MHDTVVSIFYALLLRKNHSRSHARTSCVVLLSASSITRLYSAIDWFCLSHVFSTVLASFLCTFLHESVFFLCFVIVVFSTLFLHKCFFFIYVYESFSLHFSNLHKSKICLFRHLCKLSLCCFDSLIGKMVQFRLFIYSSDCSCPFFFLRITTVLSLFKLHWNAIPCSMVFLHTHDDPDIMFDLLPFYYSFLPVCMCVCLCFLFRFKYCTIYNKLSALKHTIKHIKNKRLTILFTPPGFHFLSFLR